MKKGDEGMGFILLLVILAAASFWLSVEMAKIGVGVIMEAIEHHGGIPIQCIEVSEVGQ